MKSRNGVMTGFRLTAIVNRVTDVGPSGDESTALQRVRFSFETSTLRQAVDLANELRRIAPRGIRVRPAQPSRLGPFQWTVQVTTRPLEATEVRAMEQEVRRAAGRAAGLSFLGWRRLLEPAEPARRRTAGTAAPVRVLIVDDSVAFRKAARELLTARGCEVVGEAGCAAAGWNAIDRLKPDAVLLDVQLPDGSGLDLCQLLTLEHAAPAVLLVSAEDIVDGGLARASGARGFVSKGDLARVDLRAVWG